MSTAESQSPSLYPVFVKLAGRKVVLVGGGRVAASKLPALLDAAAEVTVVSPEIRAEIAHTGVEVVRRTFMPGDLDGAWFVVTAASREVNRQVAAAAEERHLFVNAVDDPQNGSAYLGGIVRRAGVTVAISTDGRAPALAGLLRAGFDAVLPPGDLQEWMTEAQAARQDWSARCVPIAERRPLLLRALNRLYEKPGNRRAAEPVTESDR